MDAIETLVRDFESCVFPPADFHHAQHLTVALWYLTELDLDRASERFRVSVKRFITNNGVDPAKYNETMTMFWMHVVDTFLREADRGAARDELLRGLLDSHGDSSAVFRHYSRELINSPAARETFVEPDLLDVPWSQRSRAF